MPKWICKTACVWGPEPKMVKFWKVGEEFVHPTKPNKHFIAADKVEEEFQFDKKEVNDITKDDMQLMSKNQLNDKYNLGLGKSELNRTKKDKIISMAIKRSNEKYVKRN